ncbi:MAG TPA: 2'-5' RNA ligase family protein [Candidatus Saccharimonadales bacterium]|jgi:2'-5' RNA ligase
MSKHGMTNEFGLCLLPDESIVEAVNSIRQLLPASPYRDDPPHVTLLRAITTLHDMDDDTLLQRVDELLHLTATLPLEATVRKPSNAFSPIYRLSSTILFRPSSDMKTCRKSVIDTLRNDGYTLGRSATAAFIPHFSVRLGVPYDDTARAMAEQLFTKDSVVTLSRWVIYRVFYEDGNRLVKEIPPDI